MTPTDPTLLDRKARCWVAASLDDEAKRARTMAARALRRGQRLGNSGDAKYAEACRVAATAYSEVAESYALKAQALRKP